jgi:hypothetical protein
MPFIVKSVITNLIPLMAAVMLNTKPKTDKRIKRLSPIKTDNNNIATDNKPIKIPIIECAIRVIIPEENIYENAWPMPVLLGRAFDGNVTRRLTYIPNVYWMIRNNMIRIIETSYACFTFILSPTIVRTKTIIVIGAVKSSVAYELLIGGARILNNSATKDLIEPSKIVYNTRNMCL